MDAVPSLLVDARNWAELKPRLIAEIAANGIVGFDIETNPCPNMTTGRPSCSSFTAVSVAFQRSIARPPVPSSRFSSPR